MDVFSTLMFVKQHLINHFDNHMFNFSQLLCWYAIYIMYLIYLFILF